MKKTLQILAIAGLATFASAFDTQSARADWFECLPTEIFEFMGNRIHVRCSNTITLNGNVVRFIALSTSAPEANRFTSEGQAALLSGKRFVTFIPASTATNVAGCGTDCRTPTVFGVKNN